MPRKRKPFIAIELEVFDDVPAMAQAAGMAENDFGWQLLKLWRRCWQQKVAAVSPLVIEGFLPKCTPTLVAFDFAEVQDDGMIRLRGLDRYFRIKAAQKAAADRTNNMNAQRALSAPEEDEGPEEPPQTGAVSAPDTGTPSVGKIEDRRSKIDQKDLQLDVPKKPKARKPSRWEVIFADLQETRAARCRELGKDDSPEVVSGELINVLLSKVDRQLQDLAGAAYSSPEADIPPVWEHFLIGDPKRPWAENLSPPFPIQAFANPQQLKAARERYAEAFRLEQEAQGAA